MLDIALYMAENKEWINIIIWGEPGSWDLQRLFSTKPTRVMPKKTLSSAQIS